MALIEKSKLEESMRAFKLAIGCESVTGCLAVLALLVSVYGGVEAWKTNLAGMLSLVPAAVGVGNYLLRMPRGRVV